MRTRKGVTIIELLIVIGILGAIAMISRLGVDFINGFVKQNSAIQAQREAQIILYHMTREVRNCQEIKDLTFDKLVLNTYDLEGSMDTDNNPTLFNTVNIGTITYQYVEEPSGRTFLKRTREFGGAIEEEKEFLVNRLMKPTATDYVFEPRPSALEPAPWESLEIAFRLTHSGEKDEGTHVFRMEAMKRALTQ